MGRAPIAGPCAEHDVASMRTLIEVFASCSSLLAVALGVVVVSQRRAAHALTKLACTDPLTGLANRREFMRALDAEISRTSRTGRPFAVVLLDVDGLKLINDRYGHRAGDRAIKRVANTLRVSRRATDTVGRIGGDEFAVLLPESDHATAWLFLERARGLLAGHRRAGSIVVSAGVAQHPRDGHSVDALIDHADAALYGEKRRHSHAGHITPAATPRIKREGQRALA
jgi:diguanylate cyclase (GGDEF)-like protein